MHLSTIAVINCQISTMSSNGTRAGSRRGFMRILWLCFELFPLLILTTACITFPDKSCTELIDERYELMWQFLDRETHQVCSLDSDCATIMNYCVYPVNNESARLWEIYLKSEKFHLYSLAIDERECMTGLPPPCEVVIGVRCENGKCQPLIKSTD